MKAKKYKHLSFEDRCIIEEFLNNNYTFTKIGNRIGKDRTTVSHEVKKHRFLRTTSNCNNQSCCFESKPPYVCNGCSKFNHCKRIRYSYSHDVAYNEYHKSLIKSRSHLKITKEEIASINDIVSPLMIHKHHSVNHVYISHPDILPFSKSTFYNYIHNGILSLSDLDLPKKVIYKPRKDKNNKREYKRKLALLKGRSYDDYINFVSIHPKMNICQMDTVMGTNDSHKCLLTLIIVKTNFMIIRLLDSKTMSCVDDEISKIKEKLGIKLFSKIFRIVLTDNGTEFFNPKNIEFDLSSGNKTCNVFYCKPYSSWQKGCIEKNHEYIRKIFPKGTSFDSFSEEQIHKLENIINNIPRQSLDNKTPFELTNQLYPNFISKLNYHKINPDDVSLNPKDF